MTGRAQPAPRGRPNMATMVRTAKITIAATAGVGGLADPVTREASTAATRSRTTTAANNAMRDLLERIMVTISLFCAAHAAVLAVWAARAVHSSPDGGDFSTLFRRLGGDGAPDRGPQRRRGRVAAMSRAMTV